ncbi:GEVED domain-containing protein [Carboxylicivirga sp. M1479]|uniref:GEVED domain-containing protein n=1 Tax=Carboxylicivirga sp. M1479 TaxID=2594476 RepID=UPI001178215E|nr:GEVED domain-containing protein [Carboxylicivirga sp. M1479]TRX71810.1 T9SS type A sorting domain-containing protein [Carboxylicivirga sp. M1479]
MKCNRILLLMTLLLWGTVVKAQNPYADGTVIAAGSSINQRWSIAANSSVSTAGDFTSAADGRIGGTFTVNGNYTHSGWSSDRILSGAVVEIFGNLYATQELRVQDGATLIVHGDFYNYGGGSTRLAGNIVIAGDAYLSNTTIRSTGNVVVGGDITMSGGSSSSGDVYVLDPDATIDIPGWMGVSTGDETDFINDESGNTDLNNAVSDAGLISSVDAPGSFTYSNLAGSSADLSWTLNSDNDNVIIAMYSSDTTDKPVDGTSYSVGSTLSDGAEIIFVGSVGETDLIYTSFVEGASNYLRIWSVNASVEYSKEIKLTVKGLTSADIFYEDFENGNANSWTLGSLSGDHSWAIGSAESYLGSNSAYISEDGGNSATYDETGNGWAGLQKSITIPSGFKSAEISFYWKCVAEAGYDYGRIYENNTTISDELVSQEAWVEEVIDISGYINSDFDLGVWFYCDWTSGVDPGLCIDEIRITGSDVARPQSFAGSAVSSEQVDLLWTKSTDNDDVIIAYSSFGAVGRPESGVSYAVGDYLDGGGRVIYVGSGTSYSHIGSFSGILNYTIWSVSSNAYSSSITENVTIPVNLPYSEDFEGDVSEWNFSAVSYNNWVNGSADANSGSKSAYISFDKGVTSAYDNSEWTNTNLELDVDLRGFETAKLSFQWKADGRRDRAYGECYLDGFRISGNQEYRDASGSWNTEEINVSSYADDIRTLAFRWYNNTSGSPENPGLLIDDIKISGTIANPASFSATNSNDLLNNLEWVKNTYGDDLLIAWSEDGIFDVPEEGVEYDVGDLLPGGGTILYHGDILTFDHSPLNYGTIYYYKAWSSRNGIYSSGIEVSANTPAKVSVMFEDWEDSSDGYPEWSFSHSDINSASWLLGGNDVASSGIRSSYITADGSTAGYYENGGTYWATLSISVDLTDLHTAYLVFDWMSLGNPTYDYGSVFIGSTQVGQEYSGEGGTWSSESINLDAFLGSVQTIEFRWNSTGSAYYSPAFCIDNIEVGGIYDPTSRITNGQKLTTSVSSIANSQAEAVDVFSFDLTDKTSRYNDITRIQQLVINKGSGNTIADWSDALEGARLFGTDLPAEGMQGTILSSGITFTGTDIILLENQDVAENYLLKVWLKSDLNVNDISDGDSFDFQVSGSDMVTGLGDDFIKLSNTQSGAIPIEVVATELRFSQQPSSNATINTVLGQAPEVAATDINGNIDLEHAANIVLTNDDGASGFLAMTNAIASPVDGVAIFADLTFTETGTVTLSATSASITSNISDAVTISNYCQPSNNSTDRYITNVIIESINNVTGDDGGYVEYLDQTASFAKGETYDVTIGVRNNSGTGYAIVWVDWNGDDDFADSGEGFSIGNTNRTGTQVLSGQLTVPANATSGTTRMRVRFSQRSSTGNPCTNSNGEIEDYSIVIASEGWLGQNTNWNVSSNWTTGSVPNGSTDIYIPEHPYFNDAFPIIDGAANMNDIEISDNASLTIRSGSLVTINGDITNNGDLIVENTNAKPASLITNGTVTGDISFKWTYDNLRWWFIGHPITNPVMSSYQDIRTGQGNDYALYDYLNGGTYDKLSAKADTYLFRADDEIAGYLFKVKNTGGEVVHTGTINDDAEYTRTLLSDWQIIANPYSSYYQLPMETGPTADFANTTGTVYVTVSTRNSDKTFETYNTLTGLSSPEAFKGIVAPGQGFYVKTASAGTMSMRAANRIHDVSKTSLKTAPAPIKDVLRIKLSNSGGGTDEAVVALRENGDTGFSRMDSEQRFDTNSLSYIYSLVGDKMAVINVLPSVSENYSQAVGIRAKVGEHVLRIEGVESLTNAYDLVLEDKLTGAVTSISDSQSVYEFTTEAGDVDDRFVLHFNMPKTEVPTDIGDINEANSYVNIYIKEQNSLTIKCDWDIRQKTVGVYSVSGSLVMMKQFEGEVYEEQLDVLPGIYIVKISSDNHSYQEKVFVK